MKKVLFSLSVFLAAMAVFSCSKKDADPPAFKAEGTYTGKLGSGSQIPSGFFSLLLKPGGQLDRVNETGTVTATGSWQLSGSAFTGDYQSSGGVKVNLTGTLTEAQKRINGNWSSTNGNAGSFYVTKE